MAKYTCYLKYKINCNINQRQAKRFTLYSVEMYSELFQTPKQEVTSLELTTQQTFVGLEDVLKMSSRRLGTRKIVTLKTSSRRLEDMS